MAIMNFDYSKAIGQANEVDRIANEMMSISESKLENALESLKNSWSGTSADQFMRYCNRTANDIRNEATKLRDFARRIRRVAKIIEDAEQRAKQAQRDAERRAREADAQRRAQEENANMSGGGGGGGGSSW